jgi:hypothetical protein
MAAAQATTALAVSGRTPRAARPHAPTEAELVAHAALVATLRDPIWVA